MSENKIISSFRSLLFNARQVFEKFSLGVCSSQQTNLFPHLRDKNEEKMCFIQSFRRISELPIKTPTCLKLA